MTRNPDPAISDQLSAYRDGALSQDDARSIAQLLATDPAIAAEFAALSQMDDQARAAFDSLLHDPVPLHLARAIDRAAPSDANPATARPLFPRPLWRNLAAAVALVALGVAAGALIPRSDPALPPQSASAWLDQVADYHRIYATQTRHLVEVPAAQTTHLESWLGQTTGVAFTVPDLSARGLTFQGGRLLVAAGKPVAQLMYTDGAGRVVAICFLAHTATAPQNGPITQHHRAANGVSMVWWNSDDASYVVVGPATGVDLQAVATSAAVVL